MKTLQFSKFYPPVHGGIETIAFELTEGLNQLGIRTDVLCANNQSHTIHEKTDLGYEIIRAASFGMLLSTSISPALILETKKICNNYDVIHVQMPNPMAVLAIWFARPKAKIVLHWQSDVIKQRRALKFYSPLENWILKRADAIIATTPPYAKASKPLQAWAQKVVVIPNGIKPLRGKSQSIGPEQIREHYGNRKIVFSLGRMTYYKGFDVLIDAAHLLIDVAVIVVGGEGELLEGYKQKVINEGLSNKIIFVGRIADEYLAAYFEAASVFCLSSIARSEAYGVVLLEAMAMGKPIVATDIPGSGVAWVNQHDITGLNARCNDSKSLAYALNTILSDDALADRMGAAGLLRFEKEFRVSAMIEKTVELYEKLIRN